MFTVGLLTACAQPDQDYSKLQEKTGVEQKKQSEVEQDVVRSKVAEMERDLQKRYRFYTALSYTYEGQFKIGETDFAAKIRFFPTIALYPTNRVRTIEEVTSDLNELALNSQMVMWNVQSEQSATGCAFQAIEPNLAAGFFNLFNKDCPTVLNVSLWNGSGVVKNDDEIGKISQGMADKILSGEVSSINELVVHMQPTNSVQSQDFVLRRR